MPLSRALWDADRHAHTHALAHPCLAGATRVLPASTRFFK